MGSELAKAPLNRDMTRKEEPTVAPTPDKLDRSLRGPKNKTADNDTNPYPLTEEEATPNTPRSEMLGQSAAKPTDAPRTNKPEELIKESENKNGKKEDTASGYNKFVSHPRHR